MHIFFLYLATPGLSDQERKTQALAMLARDWQASCIDTISGDYFANAMKGARNTQAQDLKFPVVKGFRNRCYGLEGYVKMVVDERYVAMVNMIQDGGKTLQEVVDPYGNVFSPGFQVSLHGRDTLLNRMSRVSVIKASRILKDYCQHRHAGSL